MGQYIHHQTAKEQHAEGGGDSRVGDNDGGKKGPEMAGMMSFHQPAAAARWTADSREVLRNFQRVLPLAVLGWAWGGSLGEKGGQKDQGWPAKEDQLSGALDNLSIGFLARDAGLAGWHTSDGHQKLP